MGYLSLARRLLHHAARKDRAAGQSLVIFAAGLVAFCGLVAISVDVGHMAGTRTDLQKTVDAAALAAAQDLPTTADAAGTAGDYVTLNNGEASYAVSFSGNDTVTVSATESIEYTFGKVLGFTTKTLTADATAKIELKTVTGYEVSALAPFVIWGGSRDKEVNPGDQNCPLHTCVGKNYTFLDNQWMKASGDPKAPDWTANGSNNFKGDINHGDGAEVLQIGDSFTVSSNGGLGSVEAPAVGSIIVVPIVSQASGNSNYRTFTIGAWAILEVQNGCNKQGCKGKILGTAVNPPEGAVGGGSQDPPTSLTYKYREYGLID